MKKIAYNAPEMEEIKIEGPVVLLDASGSTPGQGGEGDPDIEID